MPRLIINLVKFLMAMTAVVGWHFLTLAELESVYTLAGIAFICFSLASFFDIHMASMDLSGAFTFLCGAITCVLSVASFFLSGTLEMIAIYVAGVTAFLTFLLLTLNDCEMESFSSKYFYRALCVDGIIQNPKERVYLGAPFWRYALFNALPFAGVPVFVHYYSMGLTAEAWSFGVGIPLAFLVIVILDHIIRDFLGKSVLWTDRSWVFAHYHQDAEKSES